MSLFSTVEERFRDLKRKKEMYTDNNRARARERYIYRTRKEKYIYRTRNERYIYQTRNFQISKPCNIRR